MKGVTEGRIVHFVLQSGDHRPAIIVNAWGNQGGDSGMVNMVVFLDGTNDRKSIRPAAGVLEFSSGELDRCTAWKTSIHYSDGKEPNTWHWPENANAQS